LDELSGGAFPYALPNPRQQVADRADLAEEAVEHLLGIGMDPPLGVLAVLLDLLEASLQVRGAPIDPVDALVEALLGFADPAFDEGAALGSDRVQLATQVVPTEDDLKKLESEFKKMHEKAEKRD